MQYCSCEIEYRAQRRLRAPRQFGTTGGYELIVIELECRRILREFLALRLQQIAYGLGGERTPEACDERGGRAARQQPVNRR